MSLQDDVLSGFLEVDKIYGKICSDAGFITQLIFYPVALDLAQKRNEVLEVADTIAIKRRNGEIEVVDKVKMEEGDLEIEFGCSEYDIFRLYSDLEVIDSQFKDHILYGKIPPMIRQQCRNYLSSHQASTSDY
jgi:hypothetical protein|tara:strand:+ start:467 stop:865 length:399 start_codon:yes stop_codon:yes gene_type:complete